MFSDSNHRHFQKGLDFNKFRQTRHSNSLSLRRKKREEHLQKKRREISSSSNNETVDFYTNLKSNTNNSQVFQPIEVNNERIEDLEKYIMCINNKNNISQQLYGVTAIRKLLSQERNPPTLQVLKSGIIPKIISFMSTSNNEMKNEMLRFESSWIVTNIGASSYPQITFKIVEMGAIEAFMSLLVNTTNIQIIEQAIWGLGNICGENTELRNRISQTGFLEYICRNFFNWNEEVQNNAIWTVSNLCRTHSKRDQIHQHVLRNVIPLISSIFLRANNEEIIINACWSIHYFAENEDDNYAFNLMYKYDIIPKAVNLLKMQHMKYQKTYYELLNKKKNGIRIPNLHKTALESMNNHLIVPLIRFFGTMFSGTDEQTQKVLDTGICSIISPYLHHYASTIRQNVMWIFSNILAGTPNQIECILTNSSLLNGIINAVRNETHSVRREAVYCICNAAADSTVSQKKTLINAGAIEALSTILNYPILCENETNVIMIIEAFEGFLKIYPQSADLIEECCGVDYFENILADSNISQKLANRINLLLNNYWPEIQDNQNYNNQIKKEKILNPDIVNKQFKFGYNNNLNNINRINTNNSGIYQF